MSSSAAMPATGEPRMTRGTSPHASVVPRPTASRRRQISGTSSTRIQCSWMFWRSVRSAVSRPNSVEMPPMTRSCSVVSCPPSMRTRSMKYSSSSSCGSSVAVLPPSMPGLALRVEAPPAEAAVQVGRVDRREAALGVDVLDALAHGEAAVVLLPLLVGVEGGGAVDLPLPVRAGRRARAGRLGACRALAAARPGRSRPPARAGARRAAAASRHPSSRSSRSLLGRRTPFRGAVSVEGTAVRHDPTGRPVMFGHAPSHGVTRRRRRSRASQSVDCARVTSRSHSLAGLDGLSASGARHRVRRANRRMPRSGRARSSTSSCGAGASGRSRGAAVTSAPAARARSSKYPVRAGSSRPPRGRRRRGRRGRWRPRRAGAAPPPRGIRPRPPDRMPRRAARACSTQSSTARRSLEPRRRARSGRRRGGRPRAGAAAARRRVGRRARALPPARRRRARLVGDRLGEVDVHVVPG